MRNQRIRFLAAFLTLALTSVVPFAIASPASAAVPGQIVITEWMYNPVKSASEFVEVTNVGGEPVSMAGYSFDDDSGTFPCNVELGEQGAPAAVDLGARGPGAVSVAKKGVLHVR